LVDSYGLKKQQETSSSNPPAKSTHPEKKAVEADPEESMFQPMVIKYMDTIESCSFFNEIDPPD